MREEKLTKTATQITQTKIVDADTGEITNEVETTVFTSEREPNYVKIYLNQIAKLAEIKGWTANILYELIGDTKYANEGQMIVINAGYKELIAEKLDIKTQSVTNAINELKKKGILFKKKNGVFMLNPQIFGKGEWKDVKKLRYEVELSEIGTVITLKEKIVEKPSSNDVLQEQLKMRSDDLSDEQRAAIQQILSMKSDERLVQ